MSDTTLSEDARTKLDHTTDLHAQVVKRMGELDWPLGEERAIWIGIKIVRRGPFRRRTIKKDFLQVYVIPIIIGNMLLARDGTIWRQELQEDPSGWLVASGPYCPYTIDEVVQLDKAAEWEFDSIFEEILELHPAQD